MGIEVKLPELSDGIETADVLEVLVSAGDQVSKDDTVIEVETDKATAEIPSPQAGRVAEVLVKAGQTVKVGETLITIEASAGGTSDSEAKPAPAAAPPTPAPTAAAPAPPQPTTPPAAPTPPPTPSAPAAVQPPAAPQMDRPAAPAAPVAATTPTPGRPLPAGPAIRRFAREVGVDLSTVAGTGEGGRITRDDILNMVRRANRVAQGSESHDHAAIQDVPGTPSVDDWGPISVEPAARIRRTIASKMHESWSQVPRVTNFDDADVTELEKIRQSSKEDYASKGLKLTSMPFLIKSVSMALRNHPEINASYDMAGGNIIYKKYVHVGIAMDTPRGLVVPAMRNTDQLSISEIAHELASTVDSVQSGKFSVDDLRGSTFTISNLGAIGGTYSTPIVNVPELAILLVGRSRKLPVVMGENDDIVARLMMPLSLSYDHRLVDGATAARFLNDVILYLEEPGRLLLAP